MGFLQSLFSPVAAGVVGIAFVLAIVLIIAIKRIQYAGPHEALIVTRGANKPSLVVKNGRVFVIPIAHKSYRISLESRELTFSSTAQTTDGVTIEAQAVASVKVDDSEEALRAAAQRFFTKQSQIDTWARDVLSSALRSIIGGLSIDSIIRDRQSFTEQVIDATEGQLSKQGLKLDNLLIQEITDEQNYIKNIGRPELAKVERAARVAEVEANRATEIAQIDARRQVLEENRELLLREAAIREETERVAATADAAGPLEQAVQQQAVVAEQRDVAREKAALREEELNTEVRKPAEAEAHRLKVIADADAEALRLRAIAEAEAERIRGEAQASVIRARGAAEADAIRQRGLAFAEQPEAILAEQLIRQLPEFAGKFADAYANIGSLTMITSDGSNKLSTDVAGNLSTVFQAVESSTGINLSDIISTRVKAQAAGESFGEAVREEDVTKPRRAPKAAPASAEQSGTAE
ncbi:MAG: SPFH domain-containing protein [Microbacteriaceae bacterium]